MNQEIKNQITFMMANLLRLYDAQSKGHRVDEEMIRRLEFYINSKFEQLVI